MQQLQKRYYLVHIVNDDIRHCQTFCDLDSAQAEFKRTGFTYMQDRRIDETLKINSYNMAYMSEGDRHEVKILIEI